MPRKMTIYTEIMHPSHVYEDKGQAPFFLRDPFFCKACKKDLQPRFMLKKVDLQ